LSIEFNRQCLPLTSTRTAELRCWPVVLLYYSTTHWTTVLHRRSRRQRQNDSPTFGSILISLVIPKSPDGTVSSIKRMHVCVCMRRLQLARTAPLRPDSVPGAHPIPDARMRRLPQPVHAPHLMISHGLIFHGPYRCDPRPDSVVLLPLPPKRAGNQ
jgi:hypothetical protein